MTKISVDAAGLRSLRDSANRSGRLLEWSEVALEFAEQAEREIQRLNDAKRSAEDTDSRLQFPDTTGR